MVARDLPAEEHDGPPAEAGAGPNTHFAPADLASVHELVALRDLFQDSVGSIAVLQAIPDSVIVLSRTRQVVWTNAAMLATLGLSDAAAVIGRRPGEIVGCVHADESPGGCGASQSCAHCGAIRVVLNCFRSKGAAVGECRVRTRSVEAGGTLNLRVSATYMPISSQGMALVVLHDVSTERHFDMLERSVFHDTLDGVSAIYSLCGLLSAGTAAHSGDASVADDIRQLSSDIIGQIRALQTLLLAEHGELNARLEELSLREFMVDVHARYAAWDLAAGRVVRLAMQEDAPLRTDAPLLIQVLDDLVRNALEATPVGGTVDVEARRSAGQICVAVTNPGVMPLEVQSQVFQRAYSTKAVSGRGAGTYRARLITRRYLGGSVTFSSSEEGGTTFTVRLPCGVGDLAA